MPLLAAIDPYILAFSLVTVAVTVWMGFRSARTSKTASDFFVAGRSVSVGWNASAISGEYLSAASFMGVAGMVMSSGYDALWYPVCYACGYLFLLLFIAGPLRRFGAYTIPDFAEGRFDSPVFRKIAVVFVLFIGFFYTMPQMKGAGTTLAYIFPGLPYWVGVVLVGAVITLNVALGGMKGITLVQAFQYWAKMFAISVPIFVLMAVYGNYGKQIGANAAPQEQLADIKDLDGNLYQVTYTQNLVKRSLSETAGWMIFVAGVSKAALPPITNIEVKSAAGLYADFSLADFTKEYVTCIAREYETSLISIPPLSSASREQLRFHFQRAFAASGLTLSEDKPGFIRVYPTAEAGKYNASVFKRESASLLRKPLPAKAPIDATWLAPFGPLTTKAAKAAAASKPSTRYQGELLGPVEYQLNGSWPQTVQWLSDKLQNTSDPLLTTNLDAATLFHVYARETGTSEKANLNSRVSVQWSKKLNEIQLGLPAWTNFFASSRSQYAAHFLRALNDAGITVERESGNVFKAYLTKDVISVPFDSRPYALLYTYSLIIALVCGTAGLPHILVRFYTNPDGVAAKRTTMWVMILIGVFYVFPPVFGVMGRNLLPDLYNGVGAKGTDKVVLELPRILNERSAGPESGAPPSQIVNRKSQIPWGSILSGITCAGAFAAFMSTFSGLLVSMTGALAHDVYGRMLNPKATPEQRMRMFKWCAVLVGGVAILLGSRVEKLEINFMVGQAFAIAAASYFPLLFMSVWWRGLTMKGAATGMLTGGLLALGGISLTSFTTLGLLKWDAFWAAHPLLRILCEQPAIWAVPLAITLMVVVSKLTRRDVPADIRMKMLVLHAPEKLGLKQEYIQEHQHGH